MRRFVLPCLLAVFGLLASAGTAAAAEFVPGELIVRFKPGVSGSERADARSDHGAELRDALPIPRAQILGLEPGTSVRAAVAGLESDTRVDWAEPNWIYRSSAIPADPLFGDLWGLHNVGQESGLIDADIDAPEAWDQPAGAPVTVGVVDTGVALEHPDLAGMLVPGWDFVDDDEAPADLDLTDSHGTHVAGTIAAVHGNAQGIAGVARTARIMPLRALDYSGSGTSAWVASAFDYAGAAGVPVVNASLGGSQSTLIREAINRWPGTLFVVAAGNCGLNNDTATPSGSNGCSYGAEYPCSLPAANVLCVAASDRDDHRASFSNWGPTRVDLAAPGVATESTTASFDSNLATPTVVDPVFRELFDDGLTGWSSTSHAGTSSWVADAAGSSPFDTSAPERGLALSPSDPYEATAETSVAKVDPIALGGGDGCQILFDLRMDITDGDVFRLEATADPALGWTTILSRSESTPDVDADPGPDWSTVGADLENATAGYDFNGAPVYLRFGFTSGATPGVGVYVDFVDVFCTTHTYGALSGTSMATPHVAGAAAEVLAADPSISGGADPAGELKARLLDSVDASPCWVGLTVTGGRLNLARALGVQVGAPPTPTGCTEPGQEGSSAELPPPDPEPRPPSPPTGGDLGTTPTVDITPPVVTASAARRYRASTLLARGLRARIGCDEACSVRADVLIGRRTAKKLGISGRRFGSSYILLGRARAGLSSDSRVVTTRISRSAHRGLRRARSVTLVLRVVAADERGNDGVVRRSVRVRR